MMSSVFFEAWGFTLVHVCWQAAVVAGLYKVVEMATPQMRPATRYMLGLGALIAVAGLAGATLVYELVRLTPDVVAPTSGRAEALLPAISPDTALTLRGLLPWVDAAWLVGVIGLSLRMVGGLWMIHRLKTAAQQAPEAVVNRFNWAVRRMGLSGKVRIRLHPHIAGPFVIGAFRSVIYLPLSAVTALSPEQLDAVLAHELEHIRRADYAWNLVQSLIETVFFFHPAVWWLGGKLREQRELCCDDAALKSCGDPLTYATALLSLEEQRRGQPRLAMALNGQGEGRSLVGRIARMLGEKASLPRGKARPHAALALPVILLMLAAFITPVAQVAANNARDGEEVPATEISDCAKPDCAGIAAQTKVMMETAAASHVNKDHKRRDVFSEDGQWHAEFDGIDPDAIAAQVRADLMAAKAEIAANRQRDLNADEIAAQVRADLASTKADLERRGITDHDIDPDAEAAKVRAEIVKAQADMAHVDAIDVEATVRDVRNDAMRARDDIRRAHNDAARARRQASRAGHVPAPPAAPQAPATVFDEVPATLADPVAPVAPVAPVVSLSPPAYPAAPFKVKVKMKAGQPVAVSVAAPVVDVNAVPSATLNHMPVARAMAIPHPNPKTDVAMQVSVSPHVVVITQP